MAASDTIGSLETLLDDGWAYNDKESARLARELEAAADATGHYRLGWVEKAPVGLSALGRIAELRSPCNSPRRQPENSPIAR